MPLLINYGHVCMSVFANNSGLSVTDSTSTTFIEEDQLNSHCFGILGHPQILTQLIFETGLQTCYDRK